MSIETVQEKAIYLVEADGTMGPNNAGVELLACYRRVRAEREALDCSLAGAVLARLFLKHAWLDAVTLSFLVRAEYNDSGGYDRCIHSQAHTVQAVAGQPLPEHLYPDEAFDQDSAERIVETYIESAEVDLYAGLSPTPYGFDDLEVTVKRKPITALLSQSPIDGSAAIEAWGLKQPVAAQRLNRSGAGPCNWAGQLLDGFKAVRRAFS